MLIAKAKKLFTIGEDPLLPAAVVLAEKMLDKNAAEKLKTVPLSNYFVHCRVDKIGHYRASCRKTSSIQLEESTDISGNAQVIAFGRYADTDDIPEHISFCKSLERKNRRECY